MSGSRQCIFVILILALINLQWCQGQDSTPRGHLLPLGNHRDSDGHVDILKDIPSAQEFWEKYVRHRRPAVFRGIAKQFDAYSKWTDDYLKKNYGELEVKLEAKAEKSNVPTGSQGKGRDTINDFLNTYVAKDSYIVSQLPDPMSAEISVLPCITCGTFTNRILEANLWLSSGGTRSLLHKDADNAINCLLNGTKDWILINPKYEKFMPMAVEAEAEVGGFSVINVEQVNLIKYPKFKKVHFNHANLIPGDCLYLPYAYLHQVRSGGAKNMAVSVLFAAALSHEKKFNNEGCTSDKFKLTKLTDVNMVWTYPGHGPQTLGSRDPMELRDSMLNLIKGKGSISSSKFLDLMTNNGPVPDDDPDMAKFEVNALKKFFSLDEKKGVSEDEFNSMTFEQWKALAVAMDPDPANTEDYEYALYEGEEIRKIVQSATNKDGSLNNEKFINDYIKFGGSEKIGNDMIRMLDANNDQIVDKTELSNNLRPILERFDNEIMPPKKVVVRDEEYLLTEDTDGERPDNEDGDEDNERNEEDDEDQNDYDADNRDTHDEL